MKRLILVRHAKSSWKFPEMDDFDRPLNKKGARDAPRMGKHLAKLGALPDMIVTSPARRARETAAALAQAMIIPIVDIWEDERIYAASVSVLVEVIRGWDETWSSVMIVGHNPGIAELAVALTGEPVGHVPTCAVMELELNVTYWVDTLPECGTLTSRSAPKAI